MIPRYTLPEMGAIWSEATRFRLFVEVELAVVRARARRGLVPPADLAAVEEAPAPAPERVHQLDNELHHDVIAFLTAYGEGVGEAARHVHYGMTSSDLLDTTLAMQLTRAWLAAARAAVAVGTISGAVGTYANLPAEIEAEVLEELGLAPEPAPTQVVARDRHAELLAAMAVAGANIERLATEVRHLQRTEVREAEEPFAEGQKGSSAMPHKRNPVVAERLCGLARLLRGYAQTGLEDVALWHERDISHSSVERVTLPDACIVLDYMIDRMRWVAEGLVVNSQRMRENLEASWGTLYSQNVLSALVRGGLQREHAYALVQRAGFAAWEEKRPLIELLKSDPDVTQVLDPAEIEACFEPSRYVESTAVIFERLEAL